MHLGATPCSCGTTSSAPRGLDRLRQGEIDFATGPQLKDAITETLVGGDVNLVIDLLAVDFIESTGLGALIGGRRRAYALKGSLSLVCTEQQMLKIFRITGLDKVFTIHDTVDAAVSARAVVASQSDRESGSSRLPKHRDFGDQA